MSAGTNPKNNNYKEKEALINPGNPVGMYPDQGRHLELDHHPDLYQGKRRAWKNIKLVNITIRGHEIGQSSFSKCLK